MCFNQCFGVQQSQQSLCPPSSSSELQAHLFTWWGSWRGWRCRRHSHDYVPSRRSRLCPRSRPSCQGETKDEDSSEKKERSRSQTSVCQQHGRQEASNRQTSLSSHFGRPYEPPDAVQLMWPTCSWWSSTASPCGSLHIPPTAQRDWCCFCRSWGRSKHLGTWARGGGGSERCDESSWLWKKCQILHERTVMHGPAVHWPLL